MFLKLFDMLGYIRTGSVYGRGVIFSNLGKLRSIRYGITDRLQSILNNNRGYIVGIMNPIEIPKSAMNRLFEITGQGEYFHAHVGYSDELKLEARRRGYRV